MSHFPPLPEWRSTVAVLGGVFDPPHLGHREAVRELFANPGIKEVLILPSAHPPFKRPGCPVKNRLEMVKLNFSSTPGDPYPEEVRIDTREIEREEQNPGCPSYTFDSLLEYKQVVQQLAFVVGADQLAQLDRWHRFPEILNLCHWIVLERQPDGSEMAGAAIQRWVSGGILRSHPSGHWHIQNGSTYIRVVSTEAPSLASSQIREAFARSPHMPENMLLPSVAAYLKQHRLYGMKS